jgi:hypothetical protein
LLLDSSTFQEKPAGETAGIGRLPVPEQAIHDAPRKASRFMEMDSPFYALRRPDSLGPITGTGKQTNTLECAESDALPHAANGLREQAAVAD